MVIPDNMPLTVRRLLFPREFPTSKMRALPKREKAPVSIIEVAFMNDIITEIDIKECPRLCEACTRGQRQLGREILQPRDLF